MQTFATTDRIMVQIIGTPTQTAWMKLYEEPSHKLIDMITFNEWVMNADNKLSYTILSLNPGLYSVEAIELQSETFRITDDANELDKTTLIQYSMPNNRQRTDVVFLIDNMQHFFDFRVHGGFHDSDWAFSVETEQFLTQLSDIVQLYGMESTQKTFTMGPSSGVPVWFGEMLNRILVCSQVYFDGERYSRKESSVPEINVQMEDVNSFVFTQVLQRSINLDPTIEDRNKVLMRRVDDVYRAINDDRNRIII